MHEVAIFLNRFSSIPRTHYFSCIPSESPQTIHVGIAKSGHSSTTVYSKHEHLENKHNVPPPLSQSAFLSSCPHHNFSLLSI